MAVSVGNRREAGCIGQAWEMHDFVVRTVAATRELWLDLLAVLWPCACLVCGAPGRDLCAGCADGLRAAGRAAPMRVRTPAGEIVWARGNYEGALRALLVACKHRGRAEVANALGGLLRGPLQHACHARAGPLPPLIVTVPSRQAKLRARGFRHVDLMVRPALRQLRRTEGLHAYLLIGALRARPGRTGQVGLSEAQRAQNARLVCVPRRMQRRLRGREVVLVDDIATTGATLRAATGALIAAHARVIGVVVLGVTRRRSAENQQIQSASLLAEVAVSPSTAVGFVKGVKVRPPLWPPA